MSILITYRLNHFNMKKIILYIFFLIIPAIAQAATIKGKVISGDTEEALSGATIRIEGTAYGSITNQSGEYIIKSIPSGKYKALVSMIGYKTEKIDIDLTLKDILEINIILNEQPLQTGEIVVSASKRVQAVQDVPISIAVVDKRLIEDRGIHTLDQALKYVPGIEVKRDNVSVRGSSGFTYGFGSRLALLLDGFPLLSGDSGEIKFDALPMFSIERIEVVKGAGSALYGTSALGGVINLITKEPSEEGELSIRGSSGYYTQPRYEAWEYTKSARLKSGVDIGYSKKFGKFSLLTSSGIYQDDSYRKYDKSLQFNVFSKMSYEASDYSDISIFGNFAYDNHDNWVYWNSLDSATIPTYEDTDFDDYVISKKGSFVGEFQHIFNQNHFITARSGIFGTFFSNSYDTDNQYYRASLAYSINNEIQMNSGLYNWLMLTYGLNYIVNIVDAKIYGGDNTQDIVSGYLQTEISFLEDFTLTTGARLDYEKTEGNDSNLEFSPKVGLSFNPDIPVSFRASAGRGFRAPTVGERFANVPYAGFLVIQNKDLMPEKSISFEIGMNYEDIIGNTPINIDLSVFHSNFDDLIEPSFSTEDQDKIMFQNITKARIQGIELSVKAFLFGLVGLETSLTAMDPVDLTGDDEKTLKYRSKFLWYNHMVLPLGQFELQADYRFKSRVENIDKRLSIGIKDIEARVEVHVLDLRFVYKMKQSTNLPIKLILFADNALDYYYTEMVGNLAPTRIIGLQIQAKL